MNSKDFCSDISVIPQFSGTCWFNAILMTSFFSQKIRKLMIDKVSKTWDNSSLFKFFKTILKHSYKTTDPKILTLFNKIKPEMVLLKTLYKFDKDLFEILKFENLLGWQMEYINIFFKYLNVNYLDIVYLNESNKVLFNIVKNKKYKIIDNKIISFFKEEINLIEEKKEINNIIINIPDVLVLIHTDIYSGFRYNHNYNKLCLINSNYSIYDAENFNINEEAKNDIKEYNDIINLFGYNYKLDPVLLDNYNKYELGKHAIVGIHCNNNRYVYNGWNRTVEKTPCSLMKLNWDLKTNKEFCLNTDACKLDDINIRNLCFSFNKGSRILIYVKDNVIKKTDSYAISSLKSNLSNINNIILDFYNDLDISEDKIKDILNDFGIKFRKGDDLKKILNDKFLEFYGIDINKKKYLINKINKINKLFPIPQDILIKKSIKELEDMYQKIATINTEDKKRKHSSSS